MDPDRGARRGAVDYPPLPAGCKYKNSHAPRRVARGIERVQRRGEKRRG
jgi:hypothetical protein